MAYRNSNIAKSNTGGNLTATVAGAAANDYLGAFYCCDGAGSVFSYPTGFTSQASLDLATPDGQTIGYGDKVAAGGDSFTVTTSDTAENLLICCAHSGRDTTTPRTDLQTTSAAGNHASPISASMTGVTAAVGDDIAVYCGIDHTTAVWGFAAPLFYTERQDDHTTAFTEACLDTRDNLASAGATGALVITITNVSGSTNAGYAGVTIAIKKAAAVSDTLEWRGSYPPARRVGMGASPNYGNPTY